MLGNGKVFSLEDIGNYSWLRFSVDDRIFSLCVYHHSLFNRPPYDGDYIDVKLQSGKTARFFVKEYDRPSDPGDQFFYELEFSKYV